MDAGITLKDYQIIGTLQKCRIFKTLLPDEVERVAMYASPVFYKKNSVIFEERQPADFFYAVHDGLVKVYKSTASGKHVVFSVAGPGDTLNAAALNEDSYFMSAQSMDDAVLLRMERKKYHSLMAAFPAISMVLTGILARRIDCECNRVVTMLSEQVEQRLITILYDLYRKFGASLPITRQDLANCAGTSTETTIRIMSRLKGRGLIGGSPGQQGINIADPARLEELAVEKEGWI